MGPLALKRAVWFNGSEKRDLEGQVRRRRSPLPVIWTRLYFLVRKQPSSQGLLHSTYTRRTSWSAYELVGVRVGRRTSWLAYDLTKLCTSWWAYELLGVGVDLLREV